MIRRNVAGQVIYLPQLTTTDGTPITTGATLTVARDGSEAASAGTLTHSANGVWKYTPTQAETEAAIVGLILTGASAVPVVLNLVTTAANTQAVRFGASDGTGVTLAANQDVRNVSGTLPAVTLATSQPNYAPAKAGDAMTLTSGEREAVAVEVESHLLDEGDSQMLINAIVGAIGNTNIDQAVLVAAIRADLERTGGNLNTLITRVAGNIRTAADDVTAETAQTTAITNAIPTPLDATATQAAAAAAITAAGLATGDDVTEAKTEILTALGSVEATVGQDTIDDIRDGLATAAAVAEVLVAVESGGGGASQETLLAVKAKTDLITSQTANQLTLPSTTLTIVRGDSFSQGVPVDTDYTGYTASFTIRHRVTNAVLVTTSATVTSSTLVTVSLTTSQTAFALLVDPTEFGPHPYDLQFVSGAITQTRKGVAIIRQDVTT